MDVRGIKGLGLIVVLFDVPRHKQRVGSIVVWLKMVWYGVQRQRLRAEGLEICFTKNAMRVGCASLTYRFVSGG